MILALKTSDEITEIYLLDNTGSKTKILKEKKLQVGRELGKILLAEIEQMLDGLSLREITGLIVFSGPGSFTGLRIGITTMNTIAYANQIPIVGVGGNDWLKTGINRLKNSENDKIITPKYGAEPNITTKSK
jgi:universal bacterial protein YeaZ